MAIIIGILVSFFFLKMIWRANEIRKRWKATEAITLVVDAFENEEITGEEHDRLLQVIGKKPGWRQTVARTFQDRDTTRILS